MDDKKPANGTNFSTQDGLFPAKQGGLSSANKESNGTPGTFAHKGGFYRYGPTIKSNGAGPALTKVDRPILSQAPRVTLVGGGEIKSPQITQLVEAVKQEQEFSHFKDEIAITNLAIGKQIGIYETILNSDVFSKLFTDEEIRELQDQINTTIEQLQEVITTALNGGYEDSYTEILKQIKELYESFEGEVVKLNQNLEERTNKKTLENQVRIKKTLTQRYLNLNRRVMGLVDSGNNSDSIKVISEANSALSWLRNIQPSKVVSDKEFIDLTTALDELETKIQAEESSRVKIETTNKLPKEAITELFDSVSRFALAKAKDINNDENSKLRTEIENLLKIVNETSSPESIAALTGLITQYEEIVNAIPVKTDPDTIKPEPDTANGKVADTPQPEGEQNQEAIQEELQISVVNTKGKLVEILRGADFVRMNAEQYSLWRNRVSPAINAYNFYKSNPFGITNKNLPAAKNAFVNAYNNDINPKSRHILGLLSVFEQELQTEHDHFDGIREVNKALLESKPIVSDSTTDFAFLKESPLGLCVIARPGKTTKEEEWTWKLLSEEDSASVNTVKEAIATYVNIPNKTKALTSQKNELIELVNNYKFKEAEVKAKNFLTTISTNKAVSDVDQPVITKKEGPRSNIQINQIPSAVLRRTHIGTTPELVWQVSRDGADWETITDDEATTIQEELKSQEVFKVKSINPIHVRNMKKFGDVWKIKSTTGEWRELTDEESKNWKSVFGALTAFKKYVTSAASGNNIDSFNIALQSIGSPDLGTKKRDLIVAYQDNPLSPAIPELIENLLKEIETAKTLRSEVKEHNKKSLESGYTITDDTTQFAYTRKDPNNNNAVLIINKPKEGEPLSDSVYDWVELVGNNLISFEKASSAVTQFKNSERKSKALINAKNELIQLVNDYKFKEAEVKAEEFVKNFKTLLDTPDPFSEIKIDATTIESEPTPSTPEVSDKTVIKTPEKLETTSLRPLNWPYNFLSPKTVHHYNDPKDKKKITKTEVLWKHYKEGRKGEKDEGETLEPKELWSSLHDSFKRLYQESLTFFTTGSFEIIKEKKELYKETLLLENEVVSHIKNADPDVEELLAQLENTLKENRSDWETKQTKRREDELKNSSVIEKKAEDQKTLARQLEQENKKFTELKNVYGDILPFLTSELEISMFKRKLDDLDELYNLLQSDMERSQIPENDLLSFSHALVDLQKLIHQTESRISTIHGEQFLNKIHENRGDVLRGILRDKVTQRRKALPTDKIFTRDGSVMTVKEWQDKQHVEQENRQDGAKHRLEETEATVFTRMRELFANDRKRFLSIYGPGVPRVKVATDTEDVNYKVAQVIIDEEKDKLFQKMQAAKVEYKTVNAIIRAMDTTPDETIVTRLKKAEEDSASAERQLYELTETSDEERIRQLSIKDSLTKSITKNTETFSPRKRDERTTSFWERFAGISPKNSRLVKEREQLKNDRETLKKLTVDELRDFKAPQVNLADPNGRLNISDGMIKLEKDAPKDPSLVPKQTAPSAPENTKSNGSETVNTSEPTQQVEPKANNIEAIKDKEAAVNTLTATIAKFGQRSWLEVLSKVLGSRIAKMTLATAAGLATGAVVASPNENPQTSYSTSSPNKPSNLGELTLQLTKEQQAKVYEGILNQLQGNNQAFSQISNGIKTNELLRKLLPSLKLNSGTDMDAKVLNMTWEGISDQEDSAPYGLATERSRVEVSKLLSSYKEIINIVREKVDTKIEQPTDKMTLLELDTLARKAVVRLYSLLNKTL